MKVCSFAFFSALQAYCWNGRLIDEAIPGVSHHRAIHELGREGTKFRTRLRPGTQKWVYSS
jgi:hypothetical protein